MPQHLDVVIVLRVQLCLGFPYQLPTLNAPVKNIFQSRIETFLEQENAFFQSQPILFCFVLSSPHGSWWLVVGVLVVQLRLDGGEIGHFMVDPVQAWRFFLFNDR